ncbi:MAG TPA: hypothetical protein VGF25_07695 [Thermoleophilaceae bacterium]|jgi:hypothetical protein
MNDAITIRHSTTADRARIAALAELDSRHAPVGLALLAEVDGRLVAAVGVADGAVVADPFVPTADVVGLLRIQASQERGARRRFSRRPRFVPVWRAA